MALPKWLKVVKEIGPLVLMGIPGVPKEIVPSILAGIAEAEELAKPGSNKKEHAKNVAVAVANATNAVKPGAVDAANLEQTVDDAIDTVVGVANVITKKKSA